MALGVVLLSSALVLFLQNHREAQQAEEAAESILPQLLQRIEPSAPDSTSSPVSVPENPSRPGIPNLTMREVEIDGHLYIGCLAIPALDLELPILSRWDDAQMKLAPCRYFGSTKSDNLVIAGHNYARHFGSLEQLKPGDTIRFTDMNGEVTWYQVYELETLGPGDVEAMIAGVCELTLFTCTYSGQARVTIRCEKVH